MMDICWIPGIIQSNLTDEIKVELESCSGHTDSSTKTLMIVITLSGKIRINVGVSSFYPISLRTSLSLTIRGRRSVVLHSA